MGILTGKKSTPLSHPNLCRSCAWSQVMTGYRDRERLAVCTHTSPNMVIPFAMLECTAYSDRNRPDAGQVKRLAPGLESGRTTSRGSGFTGIEMLRPAGKMRGEDNRGVVPFRSKIN